MLYKQKICILTMKCSYISTRSTLTPHGSVASSNVCSITWLIVSRSERISARCLVPRTFLKVVAANRWVEWLEMTKKKLPIDTIANRVRHSKKKKKNRPEHTGSLISKIPPNFQIGTTLKINQNFSHSLWKKKNIYGIIEGKRQALLFTVVTK